VKSVEMHNQEEISTMHCTRQSTVGLNYAGSILWTLSYAKDAFGCGPLQVLEVMHVVVRWELKKGTTDEQKKSVSHKINT